MWAYYKYILYCIVVVNYKNKFVIGYMKCSIGYLNFLSIYLWAIVSFKKKKKKNEPFYSFMCETTFGQKWVQNSI